MNCIAWRTSPAVLPLVFLLAVSQLPARECGNSDFFGPYAALGEGHVLFVPPPPSEPVQGPLSRIGRIVASGDGRLVFTYTKGAYVVQGQGRLFEETFGGTYTVSRDCAIDILFAPGPAPINVPLPFTGTVGEGGREIKVFAVTPGTVAPATLHKITQREWSAGDLKGTFSLEMAGWVTEPEPRSGRFGRVGRLVADGQGNFLAYTLANYAGLLEAETFVGTYSVDFEGKIVLDYTVTEALPRMIFPNLPGAVAGPPYRGTLEGVLCDRTHGPIMQMSPTGAVINGWIRR